MHLLVNAFQKPSFMKVFKFARITYIVSYTDMAMASSFNFNELCKEYSSGVRLLGAFNNFVLK
jgi:hypothetical protein